jgi:hypothetical protein
MNRKTSVRELDQAVRKSIRKQRMPTPRRSLESEPSTHHQRRLKAYGALVLRIQRSVNGQVFTISGRIQTEDIEQFQQLLAVEAPGQLAIFDLRDVTLVNQEAVTFLADCEAKGITLESCPLHIRNWIDQEKRRNKSLRRQKRDPE